MNPLTCGILITFIFSELNISVQLLVIGTLQLFNIGYWNLAKKPYRYTSTYNMASYYPIIVICN